MNSVPHSAQHAPLPVLRRAYFDCRFGQLHVYQAIPSGGGFDERTTLLCLPAPGSPATVFQPLLARFGLDRSIFAIDPPGCGQSDAADGVEPDTLAVATLDFLRNMRLRRVHLLADGAAATVVATLLRHAEGRVTRVALCASGTAGAGQSGVDLEQPGVGVQRLATTLAELAGAGIAAQTASQRLREFLDAAAP